MDSQHSSFWNKSFLFSFSGRINRYDFWVRYVLPILGINILLGVLFAVLGAAVGGMALMIVMAVVQIAMIWIGLAITVKRLHDRNKSGWWVLIYPAITIVLGIVSAFVISAAAYIIPLVWIWYFIEIGILPGTSGENDYGEQH